MQDRPHAAAILAAVAAFLREAAIPNLPPREAFDARVEANALDLVQRQISSGFTREALEQDRLQTLLGHDGGLADLNTEFALELREGRLDASDPSVSEHLWATTLDKLAVDQPRYSAYLRTLQERQAASGEN